MKTLKVDKETNDISFDSQNSLEMVQDQDEETQSVRMELRTNEGEFFLNTLHGLAYSYLQVKDPDEQMIKAKITEALFKEPRVSEIVSLDIEFINNTRELNIKFEVKMDSGNIISGEEVI